MRGVVSGAMLSALEDLGYSDALDVVYGCSAGAVNAAYFVAGDTWYPLSIYYDNLANSEFVDFLRPFRRLPIMNLDYAFDTVVEQVKPLDYAAVQNSDLPLVVAISMLDTLQAELFRGFRTRQDLKEALIASCWLPVATRGHATFRARPALDGGVLMPSMLEAALAEGCTHVVYLHTRPTAPVARTLAVSRRVAEYYLNRLSPGLGAAYTQIRWNPMNTGLAEGNPHVLEVAPLPEHRTVTRHDINPARLLRAARDAYGCMYATLEGISRDDLLAGRLEVVPRLTVRRSGRFGELRDLS